MTGLCEDRVVIITGAGRGIGRAHALAFAAAGARVLVNDLGTSGEGEGADGGPAHEVVAEIVAAGGEAVADTSDVTDFEAAGALMAKALDAWGRLDVVVNNAGILRDGMFFKADPAAWDAVMRVHLRGHFCLSRHAAAHWRGRAKAGETVDARLINTSSGAGLQGSVAQAAYSAAKAGIAALTLVQAAELGRYGVTANAIAPAARTRMTEAVFADMMRRPDQGFDAMDPANISPLVVWLGSQDARDVTGQVFEIAGGRISVGDGWREGPAVEQAARWDAEAIGPAVRALLSQAPPPQKVYGT